MTQGNGLTIVQLNDIHGYLEPHAEIVWEAEGPTFPKLGGLARISALIKAIRSEVGDNLLVLDCGDTFHGTYAAVTGKGIDLVPAVNLLGIDAMTAHWEFAWGPEHFEQLAGRLSYPMLAMNCYRTVDGSRPFAPSLIVEKAGVKVGIVGMAAAIIDKNMPKNFSTGRRFDIDEASLASEVNKLRDIEACDLIVLLSHLGLPQDCKLAASVPDIDVVVSGHTHNRLQQPVTVGKTTIIQSGCHGSFIGRLDLTLGDGEIGVSHRLIPVDGGSGSDPAVTAVVDQILAPHRKYLQRNVGTTAIALHRNLQLFSPMDDVLLAAIAQASNTDVAFSNGWRYGAPIPPGPVTVNDLWNIIPTNPPVSTVILSGREIRAMMEENLERTFASDPYEQMGGYLKRFRGLTIFGKIENPSGHRIEHIFVGEKRLADDDALKVSFVTAQGVPEKFGTGRQNLDIKAIDALERYFEAGEISDLGGVGRFIVS